MRIRMKTLAVGPHGRYEPGVEYVLDPVTAKAFCEGGYAVPVAEPAPSKRETATDKPVEHMEKRATAKK